MGRRVFGFEFSGGTWTSAVQVEKMVVIRGTDGTDGRDYGLRDHRTHVVLSCVVQDLAKTNYFP